MKRLSEQKKKKLPEAPAPRPALEIYLMLFDGSSDLMMSSSVTLLRSLIFWKVLGAYCFTITFLSKSKVPFEVSSILLYYLLMVFDFPVRTL
jgi:hypothetical protein